MGGAYPDFNAELFENFTWDGLALVKRDSTNFVNEFAVTGGNPILAFGKDSSKVLFEDMLGSTVGSAEGGKFNAINRTSFGESNSDSELNFFTGKPQVQGLGYAFMFRNYRADQGKWQTADPMGFPDGWNNLAYVNNSPIGYFDFIGAWRTDGTSYNVFDWPLGWSTPTSDMALAGLSGYYFDVSSHPLSSALASYAIAGTTPTRTDFNVTQFSAIEADSGFSAVVDYVKNKVNSSTTETVAFSNDTKDTTLTSVDLATAIHGVTFTINGTITKGNGPWSGNLQISFSDPYDFMANADDYKVRIWGRLWANNWISRFNVNGEWTASFSE
jgi:RHS repeat-associated protein